VHAKLNPDLKRAANANVEEKKEASPANANPDLKKLK
tara:strand:+ start:216 stop:326 length:111 start_codon:yes stop_codon:yes gene_type:complete